MLRQNRGQESYHKLLQVLNKNSEPFAKQEQDYAPLLEKIGEARFVLIGEATHGTHEFYKMRAEITQQLITQKGFMAVAIEGDWPDVYQIQRYVHGQGSAEDYAAPLKAFERFPTWMWRNASVAPFLKWLRTYNDQLTSTAYKVGFFGLDLYSLHTSIAAVINCLDKIDPDAAQKARSRYACFEHDRLDPQTYGYLASNKLKRSCETEAIGQLLEIQHKAFNYLKEDHIAADEHFYMTQNARVVKNAEHYYRSMFSGQVLSWNIRDQHMFETFNALMSHLESRFNKPAKIVVWAHNSHVGDARATEMGEKGEFNMGQLAREQYGPATYLIGFSTYTGTVTAASDWGGEPECKQINPGMESSYEALFHDVDSENFLLPLTANPELQHWLHLSRLQRAIGVVYRPDTERLSHYFFTCLPLQFDSIIHVDYTTAVQPLP